MKILPKNSLGGTIKVPGDKSISHRAAIIASLADGKSRIENFSESADCAATLSCLEKLGVEILRSENFLEIVGKGKRGLRKPIEALDCGNSGTTMRLLAGALAGQNFESILIGDESLSRRPMKRIADPLRQMGAQIETENGHAPIRVFGKHPLAAIDYRLEVSSAQVKSCLLLAGLNASGATEIQNPPTTKKIPGSRDHTERLLKLFGAEIHEDFLLQTSGFSHAISLEGSSQLAANDINIPGDISSAVFIIVAASVLENSDLTITDVGLNPTRIEIVDFLKSLGAQIEVSNQREMSNEPRGDLRIRTRRRETNSETPAIIRGEKSTWMIDEIPALAVFATQIRGGIEFRDLAELRKKESDRIRAIVENLRAMNANIEEFEDGFRVGKSKLRGARLQSFGDHRIAMAFAIAALFAEGESEIIGEECANISFPQFFETLQRVAK